MQPRELMIAFVFMIILSTGMITMFEAANKNYSSTIMNGTIGTGDVTFIHDTAEDIVNTTEGMQKKITTVKQTGLAGAIEQAANLFGAGVKAIGTMFTAVGRVGGFVTEMFRISALQLFGIGWIGELIGILIGMTILFAIFNIVLRGRYL